MASSRRRRGGRAPSFQAPQDRPDLRLVRGQIIEMGEVGGDEHAPLVATFRYFGQSFRVNPDLTETTVVDLMDEASKVDPNSVQGIAMTKDYLRAHIHPEDFEAFWAVAKARRQGVADLLTTAWKILGEITAHPTGRPSVSSGGPSNTTQSFAGTSPPPAADPSTDDLRARYLKHIERYENLTVEGKPAPVGVAIAAQIATAAEARGIDVTREPAPA